MYLDDDPGVLISACLFGDGAGAAVLGAAPQRNKRQVECGSIGSLLNPGEREALRFEQRGGMLRNVLTRPVPRLAAEHAEQVLDRMLGEADLDVPTLRSGFGTRADATFCSRSRTGSGSPNSSSSTARPCCASSVT